MYTDIHRKLIKKMMLGWLLLSLAIGGIVGFVELERIDQYVVDLAKAGSARIKDDYHTYFHQPSEENGTKLEECSCRDITDNHFVSIEIYDSNKEKLLERAQEQVEPIIAKLEAEEHHFLMTDKIEYQRIFYGKRLYLKIVSPIFDVEDHHVIGYFEGVYQVSREKMHTIFLWLGWSILEVILATLLTTMILYPVIIGMNKDLIKRSVELAAANLGMLKVLGGAVAKRDSDTSTHNFRVTIYAIRLAEEIGMTPEEIRALIKGAFLHDVGKIAISDNILLKRTALDDDEREVMKSHVRHGVDIIKHYTWLDEAVDVVRFHHEKFDGSGYLEDLAGEGIPINARIFMIADVFDALTSKRPYKEAFSYESSVEILEEGAGTHFDPQLIRAFLGIARPLYDKLREINQEKALDDLLDQLIDKYFH